jgi:hypothetical protein
MGVDMPASVPGLCGLSFSSLLSSERASSAICRGMILSKAPPFKGYMHEAPECLLTLNTPLHQEDRLKKSLRQ